MGDTEYPEVKVEVVEEIEYQNDLPDWPTIEVNFPPDQEDVVGEELQVPVFDNVESFDKEPEVINVKKEEKAKSKTCPHCNRSFYHFCALRSHVRQCVRSQYRGNNVLTPGKIVIKKEQYPDFEDNALNLSNSGSVIQETQLHDAESSLGNLEDDPYSYLGVGEEDCFKGTKFKRSCKGCGLTFKSIAHARTHTLKKKLYCRKPPYKCKRCGKLCKTIHNLVDHERSKVSCRKWLLFTKSENFLDAFNFAEEESEKSSNFNSEKTEGILNSSSTKCSDNDLYGVPNSELGEMDMNYETSLVLPDNGKDGLLELSEKFSDTMSNDNRGIDKETGLDFNCQKCDLKFKNAYRLRKHIFTVHRKVTPQATRSNPSRLSVAAKKVGSSLSPFKCEGGYRCPTCEMVFTYPSRLSSHLFRKGKCYPPGALKDSASGSYHDETVERISLISDQYGNNLDMASDKIEIPRKLSMDVKLHGNSFTQNNHESVLDLCHRDSGYLSGTEQVSPNANLSSVDNDFKRKAMNNVMTKYRKVRHSTGGMVPYCKLCELSFCNRGSLNKHFQKYHEDLALPDSCTDEPSQHFGCPFCVRLFLSIKARNAHVRYGHKELHQEAEMFLSETQCDICARTFECVSEKQDHYTTAHEAHTNEKVIVKADLNSELICSLCGAQFTTKHHYSAHVNRYCRGRKDQAVNHETVSPKSENGAGSSRHKSEEHIISVFDSKLQFKCADCGLLFGSKKHYKVHVNKYCSALYKQSSNQEASEQVTPKKEKSSKAIGLVKQPKKEFVCGHCETKFSYRTLYKAHITKYCPVKKDSDLGNGEQITGQKPSTSSPSSDNAVRGPWYGKRYSCWGCRVVFESRKILYAHQRTGCSGMTFGPNAGTKGHARSNSVCSSPSESKTSTDKDWPGIGFSYICRGCKKRFNSRQTLYYHQKTVCKHVLKSLGGPLVDHDSNNYTNVGPNDNPSFICQGCNHVFSSKKTLYNHQKLVCKKFAFAVKHENQKKSQEITLKQPAPKDNDKDMSDEQSRSSGLYYTCRGCQVRFQNRKDLHVHKLTQCKSNQDDNQKVGFACQRCNKRCLTRKVLYVHQKFQCKYSKFKTSQQNQIKAEEENLDEPSLKENDNSKLNEVPSGPMLYTCRGCDIRFQNRRDLYVHKLNQCWPDSDATDDGKKSKKHKIGFVCKHCNKRCFSRKVLHVHKKFQCKYSKIKANEEKNKSDEVQGEVSVKEEDTKQNEEPSSSSILYTCHGCQTRFETRSELYVHKVTHCSNSDLGEENENDKLSKQEPEFACKHCNKKCTSRKVLFVHQKFQCKYSKFKTGASQPKVISSNQNLPVQNNADQRYYSCRGCPEKYTSRKDLCAHQKHDCIGRVHQLEPEKKDESADTECDGDNASEAQTDIKYCCAQCKEGFCNRRDLHFHKKFNCKRTVNTEASTTVQEAAVRIEIPKKKRFACGMCSFSFANRKVLYIHQKYDCSGRKENPSNPKDDTSLSDMPEGKITQEVMTPEVAERLKEFPNQCPFCKRQYCNPFVRDRHIQLHTMVKAFRCSFCPQTFSRSEYLTRHLQNEHPDELRYQCGECGLKYAQQLNCIQHINKLHKVADKKAVVVDLKPYLGDSDKQTSEDNSTMSVPKLTLKRTSLVTRFKKKKAVWRPAVATNVFRVVDDTPGRGIYSCDLCNVAKFTKMSALHRHWRSRLHRENVSRQQAGLPPVSAQVSEDSGPLICSICRVSFPDVHAFVPHRLSHLNDPLDISDATPYSCEICSSEFFHHQRVQGHLMWHLRVSKSKNTSHVISPQTRFLVPVETLKPAAKKSISPVKINPPVYPVQEPLMLPQFPVGPFACEYCSAQYASKSGVLTHMKRFCPKRFMCNECGQCFSNSKILAYHKERNDCETVETKEQFKCRHCSLKLDTVEDLGWHEKSCQKVHESEKVVFEVTQLPVDPENSNCAACKETFPSLSEASKHQETCTVSCPVVPNLSYHCLQCLVCIENFYSVHVIEKHTLLHHRDRFFVRCLPCQKLYYNLPNLTEHVSQLSVKLTTAEDDKVSEVASMDCINSSQSDSSLLPVGSQPRPTSGTKKKKPAFKCQHCDHVFKDSHNFKIHMVGHSPFSCPVCKETVTSKQSFRLHACRLPDGAYATGLKHHILLKEKPRFSNRNKQSSDQDLSPVSESDLDSQGADLPSKTTEISEHGKTIEISEPGKTIEISEPGKTIEISEPGKTIEISEPGKTIEISEPLTTTTETSTKQLETSSSVLSKLRGDFSQLMFFLVADPELMTQLGWGQKPIDTVLEDVLVHLGEKPATCTDIACTKNSDLDLLRKNVHRFLSISIKEDVLNTVEEMSHSSVDEVVSKMLLMCTENGEVEGSCES